MTDTRLTRGLTMLCRVLLALIVLLSAASLAEAQTRRGPSFTAEGLSERLDDRIVDFEKALNEMRRIRASLDNDATPEDAARELVAVHRELLAEGPLGDMVARRSERRGGSRLDNDGPGRRQGPPAVEPDIDAINAFAVEHLPDVAEWLTRLGESDGPFAGRMAGRVRGRVAELVRVEAEDPALAVLQAGELRAEIGVMRATREMLGTEDSDAARAAVRAALGRQFDAHLELRRYEILRTAERIKTLELEIAERESARESFLDTKLEQIESRVASGRLRGGGRPRGDRP
ncbi:MAG: hypothetical protein AAF297_06295 [Planctomycetota bacterium]